MMKISNGILSLSVDEKGAQMRSLTDERTGREYLWQADPAVWGRTAPVLFPAVGKMQTDGYIYGGKRYDMPKHGFIRDVVFTPERLYEDYLVLTYSPDEKTKEGYPFDFAFTAKFALDARALVFAYEVENKGGDTMYFSLGAHPGFNIKFGDKLMFDRRENVNAVYFNENDRPNPDAAPVSLQNEDTIELTEDFFKNGSLSFEGVESEGASLVSADGDEYLHMHFGKVPHLWLWAKAGAPYICIEPWHGADETVHIEVLKDKKGIIALEEGDRFIFEMKIEV